MFKTETSAHEDDDSPVLLRLLDVLKVGLALVRNSNSGGLKGQVQTTTTTSCQLGCLKLTMVDFFGLSLVFYLGSPLQLQSGGELLAVPLCACAALPRRYRHVIHR